LDVTGNNLVISSIKDQNIDVPFPLERSKGHSTLPHVQMGCPLQTKEKWWLGFYESYPFQYDANNKYPLENSHTR
jgi:hypothetical protein